MRNFLFLISITTLIYSQELVVLNSTLNHKSLSIFYNPANLDSFDTNIGVWNSSVDLDKDSWSFIKELNSNSSTLKISNLLNKNIGKTINSKAYNFSYFTPAKQDRYHWLIGYYSDMDTYFMPHSGFGSTGAMDSQIYRNSLFIATQSIRYNDISLGLNLKSNSINKTQHSYSILEMSQIHSFTKYIENRYTQKENSFDIDTGINYNLSNLKLGVSLLNISNNSTMNLSLFTNYQNFNLGVEQIDNDTRFEINRAFINNNLTISSGVFKENLYLGIDYRYSIYNISFGSYQDKISRKYQLNLSVNW
ncbi:MAG TPA: hypothetical protein ENK99_03940 [Campylobacterales bacterium]|nr:hypothetical protein [Campylobacterales bacterium]